MSTPDKTTVYIDIDDEITSIIDKVASSKERIIALVLPKRAAVLQSIVNMKLLKRAADGQKKRLVLITSEAALLPLAGAAGLHVAKNLQSRPMVPITGVTSDAIEEFNEGDSISFANEASAVDNTPDDTIDDFDPDAEAGTPVGALAGGAALGAVAEHAIDGHDDLETIELDDAAEAPAAAAAGVSAARKPKKLPKDKKNKKLAVPNFNRFRLLLVLGAVGIVVLGVLIYVCAAVLPKATVTITTDTSDITTNATLTLDPKATTVDTTAGTLPAGFQQKQQSSSQQVATTGQQNNGQTATGVVTMSAGSCGPNFPSDVPQGAGISINGLTFITQEDTTFIAVASKGKCTFQSAGSTDITAQKAGTTYNGANGTFTVAGRSDITAMSSNPTSGGTDNIVKIVAQADIDSAQAKLAAQDSSSTKAALTTALQQAGYQAINATFSGSTPSISPSASVGTPSDTVTVTSVVTYSMYGVKNSDVKSFLTSRVTKQIDPSKQTITDDGVSSASYKVTSNNPEQVAITATSVAGPDIKPATVQSEVGGMKAGEITSMLKQDPGVTDVTVKMSPFWVTSAPKKPGKINVVFVKSQNSSTSNGSQP